MEKIILPFDVKSMANAEDNFTFEGYVAAFNNIDYDRDIIEKGAFASWLTKSKESNIKSIPMFWSHAINEPIGVFPMDHIKEDDKGLFVRGILPKEDSFVSGRVIPQMKIGSVRKMSIGFKILDSDYKAGARVLKSIHVHEGSLTAIPANENAEVLSFKTIMPFTNLPLADRKSPWNQDAAIGRVRQWAGIEQDEDLQDPDVQKKYRQAFFWYDRNYGSNYYAYSLPFCDIIDGKLTAIPRGIFAAANAINSRNYNSDVPSYDRPGVIRTVERYYEKMGLESPFGAAFRIDDMGAYDDRALEKLLKSGARFSGKTSRSLISAIKSLGLRDVNLSGQRDVDDGSNLIKGIDAILNQIKGVRHA
jgi:HK97 family phage prohead protease